MNRACTLVGFAIVLVSVYGCSSAKHYRANHDAKSLYATLHSDISNGDPIGKVQELLGPGQNVDTKDRHKLVNHIRACVAKYPESYPQGLQDGDTFVRYPIGKLCAVYLQFRNDRLVNHLREHFRDSSELAVLSAE